MMCILEKIVCKIAWPKISILLTVGNAYILEYPRSHPSKDADIDVTRVACTLSKERQVLQGEYTVRSNRETKRETTNDSSVFFIDDVHVYIQWRGMQSKRHNC
jgi:hypothetical protein